ncbi:hypothetical protein R6Q59_004173 [Mikania micrantha]
MVCLIYYVRFTTSSFSITSLKSLAEDLIFVKKEVHARVKSYDLNDKSGLLNINNSMDLLKTL